MRHSGVWLRFENHNKRKRIPYSFSISGRPTSEGSTFQIDSSFFQILILVYTRIHIHANLAPQNV
jgi:hypothetical protein